MASKECPCTPLAGFGLLCSIILVLVAIFGSVAGIGRLITMSDQIAEFDKYRYYGKLDVNLLRKDMRCETEDNANALWDRVRTLEQKLNMRVETLENYLIKKEGK